MGGLISIIRGGGGSGASGGPEPTPAIDFDWDNSKPQEVEADLYMQMTQALSPSADYLTSLSGYVGCSDAIRKAISTPSPEHEQEAWKALVPCVSQLKVYYEFSSKLGQSIVSFLKFVSRQEVSRSFESYQASAKRFADGLYFASMFDGLKMANPAIQNDFSYYRRVLSRTKSSPEQLPIPPPVNDELANRMSLFYAQAAPMSKSITDTVTQLIASNQGVTVDAVSEGLSLLASLCYHTVTNQGCPPAKVDYFLRVMVMAIVLYDHVNPEGAFIKTSKVNVPASVKAIQTAGGSGADGLLNSLRYTTVHLNDESTPKHVKALLIS